MKRAILAVLACLTAMLSPLSSSAQGTFDHLKCHRMKDPTQLNATADLDALQPDFSDSGCKLTGKAKLFCVPVTKKNVSPTPPRPDIVGQQLDTDYNCYKAKCPVDPPNHDVVDQFGFRPQTKYKTSLLCVPTRKGCAPTGPHMCGGACPNPAETCVVSPVDTCICVEGTTTTTASTSTTTATVPTPCTATAPPMCGTGVCPPPQVCEKDPTTSFCYCCGLTGAPCVSNGDCCAQSCVGNVCQ